MSRIRRVIDLSQLTYASAFQLAVSASGISHDEIADRMGWAPDKATRIFNLGDDYWPAAKALPQLCAVLGNTIIAEWVMARSGVACPCGPSIPPAADLMDRVAALTRETAAVMREAGAALADDGRIDSTEARRVLREVNDVAALLPELLSGLQAIVDAGKGGEGSR